MCDISLTFKAVSAPSFNPLHNKACAGLTGSVSGWAKTDSRWDISNNQKNVKGQLTEITNILCDL